MALLRCGFVDVYQGELVGLRLLPGWDFFQVPYPMGPGVWGVVGVLSCVRWSWMAGLAYPGGVVGVVVGLLGQFVGAVVGGVNRVVVPLGRFDAGVLWGVYVCSHSVVDYCVGGWAHCVLMFPSVRVCPHSKGGHLGIVGGVDERGKRSE